MGSCRALSGNGEDSVAVVHSDFFDKPKLPTLEELIVKAKTIQQILHSQCTQSLESKRAYEDVSKALAILEAKSNRQSCLLT